jgi:acyl carrier protein
LSADLSLIRECFRIALKLDADQASQLGMETDIWNFPKWNSLGHIGLILELEKAFRVKFPESQTAELISVEAIVKALDGAKPA